MSLQESWLVLIPAVVTIVIAILSRRPIESLLSGRGGCGVCVSRRMRA